MSYAREPKRETDPGPSSSEEFPLWSAVPRGVAFFLGGFLLLDLFQHRAHASIWWIEAIPTTSPLIRGVLAFYGIALLMFAWRPHSHHVIRLATRVLSILFLSLMALECLHWNQGLRNGAITSTVRIPFHLHLAALMGVILAGTARRDENTLSTGRHAFVAFIAFDLCVLLFPLAQLMTAGWTNDASPSDAILVFVESSSPTEPLISRLNQFALEETSQHVVLIGQKEHAQQWQSALLQHPSEAERIIETAPEGDDKAFRQQLEENGWDSLLLVGDPLAITTFRIRWSREGKSVSQIVMDANSNSMSSRKEAVRQLWQAYVNPETLGSNVSLPTASIR